ncbi:hypothetical protein ACQP1O_19085 [Nocardia sp. CA-151230]
MQITVRSDPSGTRYQRILTVPFGAKVSLPATVNVELDTGLLMDRVR